jgi:hypothetical protein
VSRHVNAIAGRLSLRAPQRRSLEILDRITELVPPRKGTDVTAALAAVRSEFPSVTDFERAFLSVCFAVILDRETARWFKPAKGQFRIHYRHGSDLPEYQPDFVAETDDEILMLEVKMKSEIDSPEVLAKKQAAVTWCGDASDHAKTCGGKPWRYALIAHDVITENMSLASLVGSSGEVSPKG